MAADRPVGNVLGLATMMFHDEVFLTEDIEMQMPAENKVTDKELPRARHVIQASQQNMLFAFLLKRRNNTGYDEKYHL